MYEYLETDWYRANAYTFYEMDMRIVNEARMMDLESFQRKVIKFNKFKKFIILVGIIFFCIGLVAFFISEIGVGWLILFSYIYLLFLFRTLSLRNSFKGSIAWAKDKIEHCMKFFSEMVQLRINNAYHLGVTPSEVSFDQFGQFLTSQNSVRSELVEKYKLLLKIENLL